MLANINQLKDIHEPLNITWWPIAFGWWMLLVCCLLIIGLWFFMRYWKKKNRLKNISLSHIKHLKKMMDRENDHRILQELSTLLRQIAIASPPLNSLRMNITGELWMKQLDDLSQHKIFQQGIGNILINAPYQSADTLMMKQGEMLNLLNNVERWIKKLC